ncbi:MAG: type 1 glutamine amidotransferase [Planctomycetes bacterium]|nr:type 1 glutamine amidotransferase [Planctomycetota bacterium]
MASKGLAVVLVENLYENLELHYPRLRLEEAGFDVKLAAPKAGETYTSKEGFPAKSDVAFKDLDAKRVKVLVVPGGYCPDKLRRYADCNALVAGVFKSGGVVAAICHGGWVPISAGILKGKRLTSVGAIKDDLVNAGAQWVDEPCVVDGNLVTAQVPKDLPAFMRAILSLAG